MKRKKLSVLFVTVEADPYATKAGLGHVAGSLPQALKDLGADVDIRVILPRYGSPEMRALEAEKPFQTIASGLPVPFGGRTLDAAVQMDDRYGVTTYLVDNHEFFGRDARIYWPPETPAPSREVEVPNITRFAFFSRAVLEVVRHLRFRPDVIHCNDWHTALVPVYLRTLYDGDPFFRDPDGPHHTGSVLTLHNVGRGFQGIWPLDRKPDVLELAGLDAYKVLYDPLHGLAHSAHPGKGITEINLFKGGVVYADRVNAVSDTYAQELRTIPILTGSDDLMRFLRWHEDKISGIVNGLDYTFRDGDPPKGWDPERDTCIAKRYTVDDLDAETGRIPAKSECKRELQRIVGLREDADVPLIGLLGRLEPQKGIVLILHDICKSDPSFLKALDVQLLIWGKPGADTEGARIRETLATCAGRFSDWLHVDMTFVREALVHKLFAGCDMILMPSEYEPCGLPQMQGHRYGTIPIVRKTGGLADTVTDGVDGFHFESLPWDADEQRIAQASGSMLKTIARAVDTYRNERREWGDLVRNAMTRDHTWAASARKYLELYELAHRPLERAR